MKGDTSKGDDAARLFVETKKAFGTPNVLVNNAGVFRPGPFAETTEDIFHWHYHINVLGPVLTTLEAIKHFGDKGGSIVNISSIVGSHPPPMISTIKSRLVLPPGVISSKLLASLSRRFKTRGPAKRRGHSRSSWSPSSPARPISPRLRKAPKKQWPS